MSSAASAIFTYGHGLRRHPAGGKPARRAGARRRYQLGAALASTTRQNSSTVLGRRQWDKGGLWRLAFFWAVTAQSKVAHAMVGETLTLATCTRLQRHADTSTDAATWLAAAGMGITVYNQSIYYLGVCCFQ